MSSTVPQVPYTPPAIARRQPIGPMLNGAPETSDPGGLCPSAYFEQ
ncbi:MAG: hypothetical protein ACKOVH_02485 [Actinomycetota bacterium]